MSSHSDSDQINNDETTRRYRSPTLSRRSRSPLSGPQRELTDEYAVHGADLLGWAPDQRQASGPHSRAPEEAFSDLSPPRGGPTQGREKEGKTNFRRRLSQYYTLGLCM